MIKRVAGLHLDVLADVAVLYQIVEADLDRRLLRRRSRRTMTALLPAANFVRPLVAIMTSSTVMCSR